MAEIVKRKVGALEVIALTDGATEFGPELFLNTSEEEIDSLLKQAHEDRIKTNFNAFIVRGPAGATLIDAGIRDLFGPAGGQLPECLTAAGIAPGDVTRIVFTHLHPDHIAGAITADGAAVFANAEVAVSKAEHAFWSDAERFAGMGEPMEDWQRLAAAVLAAYDGRLNLFDDTEDAEAAPGITTIPLPGHTPGHTGLRIADGGEQLVHVGDIVHAQTLQVANPEIGIGFDVDPVAAAAARRRMLDVVATDKLAFSGGHILSPHKFVHAVRDGSGYKLDA